MNSTIRKVTIEGKVDSNNSTTTPLSAGGTWFGTATEILNDGIAFINVYSDVASATDGLHIEQSSDGVNWDHHDEYTVPAATGKNYSINPHARYFRVHYTNGGSNQTEFRLQTILKSQNAKPSSHRIKDTISDNDDATLGVVIPKLRTAQDNYVSMAATNSGNQKVSLEEYNGSIATGGLPITYKDNSYIDAFGRLRTSNTGQRFDVEFIYDKQPSLMDEIISGGGTITHNSTSRDVTLAIGDATNGSEASFIQHWHNPYTPGNSQLIDITGTLDAGDIGGGTASIFLKDGITSTETEVTQASWDNNPNDIDWTTSQIFQMDFQSLKVGRIRFNLVRDGIAVNLHELNNDNARIAGYWQYPAQPLQWRIYNSGGNTIAEIGYFNGTNGIGFRYTMTANASAAVRAICGTVKSEGGEGIFDIAGLTRSADMGVTTATVSTTFIPILSIRQDSVFNSITNHSLVIPEGFTIQTDNPIRLVALVNPTLTGASWSDVDTTNSSIEVDTTASAVSGGIEVYSEYVGAGSKNTVAGGKGILGKTLLAYGSNSVGDILTLAAVRTTSTNASVLASLNWREIR